MPEPTFGEKIKEIRLSKGDSIRKIALYAGISASYYSQVENNKRRVPKPTTLRKIAKGLRISDVAIYKLANLIPEDLSVTDQPAQKKQPTAKSRPTSVTVLGVSDADTSPDTSPKIDLINSRLKLQVPANAHVHTQLSQYSVTRADLTWLRITETNLLSLGILKGDLVVVDTTMVATRLATEHPKLVAVNLTTSKTTVRRAIPVTNDRVMLTTGMPNEPATFLSAKAYDQQLAGAVVNIYRDVH